MADATNLKERIHRGEVIFGVGAQVYFNRTQLEDLLAQGDYSFVYVDSQHTAFCEIDLENFCGHAEQLGIPVQFRIPHTRHTYLVGRYLDLGPTGIMVPEVESTAEVDEAIKYFYYAQVGRRAYADWWNSNGFLAIQLESVEAIINAGKLAKPGVDLLAFGPNDLRFSMESLPYSPFKTVDECIRHVLEQMKDSTVQVSLGATTEEERDRLIEMGVTVLQVAPGM